MKQPVLSVQGLTLAAAGRVLVRELSFAARAGERWCVIGRNAAGKSTLLRALAGLAVPQACGSIALQGDVQVLQHAARAAALRAYLPQQAHDRFELTVREWLQLHQRAAAAVPLPMLQALDVGHLLERPVTRLSGGERQRVGLAGVAMQDAPLWLLDEPVSFQDPAHQRQVARWLCAQALHAMVMSAHDLGWVQQTATHVIVLMDGGGWQAGPVAQVLNPATLGAAYGCEWRLVQGYWLPAD
jgi:iron complex transport system ATP-binding protein